MTAKEEKLCEQCQKPKPLSAFHRRKNKTDGRMRICAECYMANLQETQRRQRELQQQQWERKRRKTEESQRVRESLPMLMLTLLSGETKNCEDCKQEFPIDEHGCLVVPFLPPATCERCGEPLDIEYHQEGRVSYGCQGHIGGSSNLYRGQSEKYCPTCHEERRKKNRQAYPLCPMCNTPTRVWDFLKEYQGHRLDIIKVCCKNCIPRFESLPEQEQCDWLRRAMIKAYGEKSYIYALHYEETDQVHHIGRTKHLQRRMAEYRRNWYREIKAHGVLEEIPFGPLSMERESRWIIHALKYGWLIDNFDMFTPKRKGHGEGENEITDVHITEMQRKALLIAESANLDPLTCPFEDIAPLIRRCFLNTLDMYIVHWLIERDATSRPFHFRG